MHQAQTTHHPRGRASPAAGAWSGVGTEPADASAAGCRHRLGETSFAAPPDHTGPGSWGVPRRTLRFRPARGVRSRTGSGGPDRRPTAGGTGRHARPPDPELHRLHRRGSATPQSRVDGAPLPEPRSRPVDDEPQPSTAPDLATGLHRRHRCHGGPRRQRCGDRPGRRRHPDRRGAAGHRLSSPRLPVRCDRVGVATGGVSSVRVASLVLGSCSRFLRIRALEALTDRRDVERQVLQHFNRARGEHEREDQPSVSLRMCDTRSHRCGSV